MFWVYLISGFIGFISLCYYGMTRTFGRWEAKGLPSIDKPTPLFGNLWKMIKGEHTPRDNAIYHHKMSKGLKYGVVYLGTEPLLYVRDPKLVKIVSLRDSEHFIDSGFIMNTIEGLEINDMGLVTAKGDVWKTARGILSPAMSSRNLKVFKQTTEEALGAVIEVTF